jgi:flagellar hook-length control protein FliK
MNASGLDAIFKTDNAMTRDLIAQGTQRLRDNLTQAGMTVANVWVNSHQQQSTGGNSTPRQQSGTNSPMTLEAVETVDVKKGPNVAKSSDGWDQLV